MTSIQQRQQKSTQESRERIEIKRLLTVIEVEGSLTTKESFGDAEVQLPDFIEPEEILKAKASIKLNKQRWYREVGEMMKSWYTRDIMSDITLYCGTPAQAMTCHRSVLVAFTTFFDDMFRREKDTRGTEVTLPEITSRAMFELLKWMYTGDIVITYENVLEIKDAANKLGIPRIEKRADELVELLLQDENVMSTVEVAERFNQAELLRIAKIRLFERFYPIIKMPSFLDWSIDRVVRLLSADELKLTSEVDVFDAGVNWMNYRRAEREQYFLTIVDCVRWCWMSQDDYLRCVDREPQITRVKESKLKITEANWFQTQEMFQHVWEQYKSTMPKPRLINLKLIYSDKNQTMNMKAPANNFENPALIQGPGFDKCNIGGKVRNGKPLKGESGDQRQDRSIFQKKRNKKLLNTDGKDRIQTPEDKLMEPQDCRQYFPLPSQTILLLGGHRGGNLPVAVASQVIMLDPKTGTWDVLTNLPSPRIYHSVVEIDNDVYVVGGLKVDGDRTNYDLGKPQRNFWRLNSASGQFEDLPPLHRARHSGAAVNVYGMIHYFGGSTEKQKPCDINEQFDPRSNRWDYSAHVPGSRSSPSACAYEDRVFLAGGIGQPVTNEMGRINVLNDMWQFTVYDTLWSPLTALPEPRCMGQMVEIDGLVYYFGGASAGEGKGAVKSCSEIFAYDPLSDRWEIAANLVKPRHSFGVAKVGHIVFIIGGVVTGSKIAAQDVEIFNAVKKTCQLIGCPLPTPRVGCAAVVIER